MRKAKKTALDALDKAARTHNCWSILDEAVTCGEDDQFTREYIEGEREMLANAIYDELRALARLGRLYGIGVVGTVVVVKKMEDMR